MELLRIDNEFKLMYIKGVAIDLDQIRVQG